MNFAIVQDGKTLTPSTSEEIQGLIKNGKLKKTAQIWRPPWPVWAPASEVFAQDFGLTSDLFKEMEERGEFPHQKNEDIYSRILRVIPSAPLEELLRKSKEGSTSTGRNSSEVRITSKNKEELVQSNIRDAVRTGGVEQSALEALIQEYEESGRQRIFLYSLRQDADPAALEFTSIITSLMGRNWKQYTFPIFHSFPSSPEVSSFRTYKSSEQAVKGIGFTSKHSEGWICRIDASVSKEECISRQESNASVRAVTYATQLVDTVCVIRYWNALRLLEIRIPNFLNRGSVLELRDLLISKFGKAMKFALFEEWMLAPACTKITQTLLEQPGKELGISRIAGSLLREQDQSTMKIELRNTEAGDVRTSDARRRSIQEYLKNDSQVESMICWFAPPNGLEELRITVAGDAANEISVRKQINAVALDYVIHRLHANTKARS